MASIYDIDYSKIAVSMLPPDKRYSKMVAFVQAFLKPMQWVRDLWLGDYRTGTTAAAWVAGTYSKYSRVVYNKVVYESAINGNTDTPSLTTNWFIVQSNFIGLSERVYYNGQCLTLTYALNKWFGTTFRQPPAQSDIYLVNAAVIVPKFRISALEPTSSTLTTNTSSEFISNAEYNGTTAVNFSINCPVAVYNALDTNMVNNDKIFRSFADKYIPAGILYNIITY